MIQPYYSATFLDISVKIQLTEQQCSIQYTVAESYFNTLVSSYSFLCITTTVLMGLIPPQG